MLMSLGTGVAANFTTASGALVGAQRHALTVGFVTLMIYGMASKMIPVFEGRELGRPHLLMPVFWQLMTGNVMRVGFQIAHDVWGGWLAVPMGLSGGLELLSGFLSGAIVWESMRTAEAPPEQVSEGPIRPEATIGDLLARHPEMLDVFLRHVLEPLRSAAFRPTVARTISLRTACKVHKIELEAPVKELEAAVSVSGPGAARRP